MTIDAEELISTLIEGRIHKAMTFRDAVDAINELNGILQEMVQYSDFDTDKDEKAFDDFVSAFSKTAQLTKKLPKGVFS